MEVSQLSTDGFVSVKYPPSLRTRVQEAMHSWQNFCALPAEDKLQFSDGNRVRDFGYMLRSDSGPRADKKELFHVSRDRVAELQDTAHQVLDKRAGAFIDAIDLLLTECAPLIQTFAQEVESRYALKGFEEAVMEAQDTWTYRYLHYFGGESIAHAHADRGGFTLHLHETHPGGEYLGFDRVWRPWPVTDTETIIFPAMNLQHYSRGALKALWHRVQPTPETMQTGRYSMVAFIDFTHAYEVDRVRRMQDLEPGFNYSIVPEGFDTLFVRK